MTKKTKAKMNLTIKNIDESSPVRLNNSRNIDVSEINGTDFSGIANISFRLKDGTVCEYRPINNYMHVIDIQDMNGNGSTLRMKYVHLEPQSVYYDQNNKEIMFTVIEEEDHLSDKDLSLFINSNKIVIDNIDFV